MRTYLSAALIVLMALSIYISYQQGFLHNNLPKDEEQQGLNEQITLRFSHVVAENTPKGQAVLKFSQLVAERSNNQIIVEISPNGLLYNDNNELQALKNNDVQMIAPTFSKLTTEAPSWQVLDLPYLFQTNEEIERVFSSDLSSALLKELDDPAIKALAFWHNGFKQMLSKERAITSVKDFKGLKIRTMPSNILRQQFIEVNAYPVNTSFDELLTSTDKQKVDAMENTVSNIYSKRFYKEQPYLTLSNHGVLAYSVLINQKFWHSLSSEHQQIIEHALNDVTTWNSTNASKMNSEDLQRLKEMNMTITSLTTEEKKSWKKAFQPLYTQFKTTEDAHYLDDVFRVLHKE